jgi:hypothetical protein
VRVMPDPAWANLTPSWGGISCRIGRVQLWFPVRGSLLLRPFSLLVLLPDREPSHALPYVLLGAQFLMEYEVTATLDCSGGQGRGHLSIP